MKILVDADSCPVIHLVESIARRHNVPVCLYVDTAHILSSDYSEVKVIDKGADSVDFAILSECKLDDIVVTNDTGLASMALAKGSRPVHSSGRWYTNENIDSLIMSRYMYKQAVMKGKRRPKHRSKSSPKPNFRGSLEKLILTTPVREEEIHAVN